MKNLSEIVEIVENFYKEPIENLKEYLELYKTAPFKASVQFGLKIDEWIYTKMHYIDYTFGLLIDEKAPPRLIAVALMITKCIKNEIPNRKRLLDYYFSVVDNEEMRIGF